MSYLTDIHKVLMSVYSDVALFLFSAINSSLSERETLPQIVFKYSVLLSVKHQHYCLYIPPHAASYTKVCNIYKDSYRGVAMNSEF